MNLRLTFVRGCRLALSAGLLSASYVAFASGMLFASSSPANNASTRTSWLSAAGVTTPEFFDGFETYAVGTVLNGSAINGGAVLSATVAIDQGGVVQSNPSFFGGATPIDTKALALVEQTATFTFATPVDYFGAYRMDAPGLIWTITYSDGQAEQYGLGNTGSNGVIFAGIWRNNMPKIKQVTYGSFTAGDGKWGLDNIEYGAVPEPTSLLIFGLGTLLVGKRSRRP